MIDELEKEKNEKDQSNTLFVQKLNEEMIMTDTKLEKIMNDYLENALNIEEYRNMKNKLINQKQLLKDKLLSFEQKGNNWFELVANFINSIKQSNITILQENPEQSRDFLKKIGSNFRLINQNLFFDFKNPYKIIVDYEPEHSEGETKSPQNPNSTNWRKG